jgi:hypothetical protein
MLSAKHKNWMVTTKIRTKRLRRALGYIGRAVIIYVRETLGLNVLYPRVYRFAPIIVSPSTSRYRQIDLDYGTSTGLCNRYEVSIELVIAAGLHSAALRRLLC